MSNVTELVDHYLAAWNERDARRRRDLIAKTWTDDGSYVDPARSGNGHDAISAMIGQAQENFPGVRLRLAGAIDAFGDRMRFRWEAIDEKGAPIHLVGADFGVVANDGRLKSVTGFIDQTPVAAH